MNVGDTKGEGVEAIIRERKPKVSGCDGVVDGWWLAGVGRGEAKRDWKLMGWNWDCDWLFSLYWR